MRSKLENKLKRKKKKTTQNTHTQKLITTTKRLAVVFQFSKS